MTNDQLEVVETPSLDDALSANLREALVAIRDCGMLSACETCRSVASKAIRDYDAALATVAST